MRVDTTLVGFDQNLMNWERGNMSFIFRGTGKLPVKMVHLGRHRACEFVLLCYS